MYNVGIVEGFFEEMSENMPEGNPREPGKEQSIKESRWESSGINSEGIPEEILKDINENIPGEITNKRILGRISLRMLGGTSDAERKESVEEYLQVSKQES